MVNLLFITSCNKFERIKSSLQPLLKVKIDVVADFDIGLKDVFEKRPATVFIQDQIAGVTGESVARHIQMLLGVGAPSFVFMHEGSTKAKPVKGLFEYLVDLSQTDAKIVKDILDTLKSHLGPQWDKVYLAPKVAPQVVSDSSLFPNLDVAEVINPKTDIFATSSVSGVGSAVIEKSVKSAFDSFDVVSSPQDQLAEIIAASEEKPVILPESPSVQCSQTVPSLPNDNSAKLSVDAIKSDLPIIQHHVDLRSEVKSKVRSDDVPVPVSAPLDVHSESAAHVSISGETKPVSESPADFVIVGERSSTQVAPEELLRVFENSVQPHTSGLKRIVLISLLVLISVLSVYWLSGKQISQLRLFSKRSVPSSSISQPKSSVNEIKQEIVPAKPVVTQSIPSFVPIHALDKSFSSAKPGWERYLDSSMDYRLYRSGGRIQAVQVLGVHNRAIEETLLKSALRELVGTDEYRVNSRKTKDGFSVEQAVVGQNSSDLLIYRKKNVIRAFVISVN